MTEIEIGSVRYGDLARLERESRADRKIFKRIRETLNGGTAIGPEVLAVLARKEKHHED
jgi:hypothetical protein